MAKIEYIFNDVVAHHTDEEIVAWLNEQLKRIARMKEGDPLVRLGTIQTMLSEIVPIVDQLDKRMNKEDDPAVVA